MEDTRHDNILTYDTPAYKPRKRKLGDRRDGRRVRTLPAMNYITPYIMKVRSDAQNHFEDVVDITNIEHYLDKKHREGYTDMTLLHVLLAAYVRVVAERPGLNRFIAGQKIYHRDHIECLMTIKKDMSLDSPDTCIKVEFDPRDNVYNVYKKFQKTVLEAKNEDGDFESIVGKLVKLPGLVLRFAMHILLPFLHPLVLREQFVRLFPFDYKNCNH